MKEKANQKNIKKGGRFKQDCYVAVIFGYVALWIRIR
jgi:hypothetical protein